MTMKLKSHTMAEYESNLLFRIDDLLDEVLELTVDLDRLQQKYDELLEENKKLKGQLDMQGMKGNEWGDLSV